MTLVLRSLQLKPRGEDGWSTPPLVFGESTTLVRGPLGSGKTPIFKALALVLGMPVEMPPVVPQHCSEVVLTLEDDKGLHELRRAFDNGFLASAVQINGERQDFPDEESLGKWVLERFGVPNRYFASLSGDKVFSYISIVGPVFIVGQDYGWTGPYVTLDGHRFVKNQRQEVIRWVLDLPAKNRGVDRSAYDEAKTEQAAIQDQIRFKRRTLEKLGREIGADASVGAAQTLTERRAFLRQELSSVTKVLENASRTESSLDIQLRETVQRRDALRYRLNAIERRRAQVVNAQGEVLAETEALEQNEVAATAFRTLCASENCQFFRQPEESYGRRLLYLRDQLKDFAQTHDQIGVEICRLQHELVEAEASASGIETMRRDSLASSGGQDAVAAVETLTRDLADVSVRLDRLDRIQTERTQLEALINLELRAAEKVAELKPTGNRRSDGRLLDARSYLAASFNEWVRDLQTPNVPLDATVDDELNIVLGGEKLNQKMSFSGSTRTRLILAFHGALVETSIKMNGNHPPILLLDAPRQHELSSDDVKLFVTRFEAVTAIGERRFQLLLTSTDEGVVPGGVGTRVWTPPFKVDGKERFLGSQQIPVTA